jgi:hypothetical protein
MVVFLGVLWDDGLASGGFRFFTIHGMAGEKDRETAGNAGIIDV